MFGMFPFNNGSNNNWNSIGTLRMLLNDDFLNSMVNQILANGLRSNLLGGARGQVSYEVELKDYGEYYLIKGYLPGATAKDISIDFEKNKAILTVRRKRTYSNGRNFSMTISGFNEDLVKSFYIDDINTRKMKASFNDNFLMITLPKVNNVEDNHVYENIDEPIIIDVDSYKVE